MIICLSVTGKWRQSLHLYKQNRNLKVELIQMTWKGTSYWFPLHGLLCLISYTTQGHQPQGCPRQNWLGCPTSMLIREELIDLTMVQFSEGIFSIEICWEGMSIFYLKWMLKDFYFIFSQQFLFSYTCIFLFLFYFITCFLCTINELVQMPSSLILSCMFVHFLNSCMKIISLNIALMK